MAVVAQTKNASNKMRKVNQPVMCKKCDIVCEKCDIFWKINVTLSDKLVVWQRC